MFKIEIECPILLEKDINEVMNEEKFSICNNDIPLTSF